MDTTLKTVTLDLLDAMEASIYLERYANLLSILTHMGNGNPQPDVDPSRVSSVAARLDEKIIGKIHKGV